MEEKTLVKSELCNIKVSIPLFGVIGILLGIIDLFKAKYDDMVAFNTSAYSGYKFKSLSEYIKTAGYEIDDFILPLAYFIIFFIVGLVIYLIFKKTEITITEKTVYGCGVFGKKLNLPVDSITSVETKRCSGILIKTPSSKIHFAFIKNRDEILNTINGLISTRNTTKERPNIINQEVLLSNADELKKYKDLLDSGVINQEEFDAKKKELLGL